MRRRLVTASAPLVLAAALVAVPGCTRSREPAAAPDAARRYTVRGEVVELPQAPRRDLLIRHEAIADFTDEKGKTVGMQSMTMPFPVDPSVSLAGIDVGDKIRFRFRMDWANNAFAIESIEELPADTRLEFGGAQH